MSAQGIRVGVDVGGTFTKAVALATRPVALRAHAVVPTTHGAAAGVAEGVAEALGRVLEDLGPERDAVELVAYSTTQAMNALLEGDVARVGIVGIGAEPDLRVARKRTRVGTVRLAAGRVLDTEHVFLDASRGLTAAAVDAALDRLAAAGCTAVAASGAFAVDSPEHERLVSERARARGLAVCAGYELSGAYGLETRTVSAAINASILPLVERTATVVEDALGEAGLAVPLLVLRGDGGAMSLDAFRRAPSFTIGSGPAAGVAAALHELGLVDGIVLECGGTSSNVSVVKGGRTALRTLRVMGRLTAIRSIDSWVVGAAGGSMARIGRRGPDEVGPRSAHVAGLPYACFAGPGALEGARLELAAPRAGDPEQYGVAVAADGTRFAITATCAAHALGLVEERTEESAAAARAAFALVGRRTKRSADHAAHAHLDGAVDKIARAVDEAARAYDFCRDVPVVALGGAGTALAPTVAARLGRPCLEPGRPEILSSIGAALSLVRAEIVRHGVAATATIDVGREAERACIDSGAAPSTVRVETSFEPQGGLLRAVACGAVALESGAADREPVGEPGQLRRAATALGLGEERLEVVVSNDFYRVFSENGSGGVAVVDGLGSVALAEHAKSVVTGDAGSLLEPLHAAVGEAMVNLGVATLLPRVAVVCGPHVVDLSGSRRIEDVLAGASAVLDREQGPAVGIVWQ